jgi:hypothetical protein
MSILFFFWRAIPNAELWIMFHCSTQAKLAPQFGSFVLQKIDELT